MLCVAVVVAIAVALQDFWVDFALFFSFLPFFPSCREMGSELGSLKFINKKAKKDKKRNSIRKLEKDRPWPSIKTRLAAKSHYPTKLPEKRPCTWCFNRRCGQKKLTKYHCEHCKVDLCAVPCFKEFHTEEKSHARKSSRSKNRDSEDGDEVLPSSPPST